MKNKVKKFFIKAICLPFLIFMVIFVIILGSIVEVPKAIGKGISEFFKGDNTEEGFLLKEVSLFELKKFFMFFDPPPEIADFQSNILLVKYVDMQIKSGVYEVQTFRNQKKYIDGELISSVNEPITLTFDTSPYTTPWQFLSAIDIANETFKNIVPSEEALVFNNIVRPMFDGNYSHEYVPVFNKVTTQLTKTTRTQHVHLLGQVFTSVREEKIVTTEPLPIIGTIKYHSGKVTNKTENDIKTKNFSNSKIESYVGLSIHTEILSNIEVVTPYIQEQEIEYDTTLLLSACNAAVKNEQRDLLIELLNGYPFMEPFALFFLNPNDGTSVGGGPGPILDIEQPERTYNFNYPKLKRDEDGKLYREDIIKLAMSVQGLDYFWGGKHPAKGFNKSWGSKKKIFASGHPASGHYTRFGFDCSGFTEWVYFNVGQKIGGIRTSITSGKFKEVKLSQLKPGDIATYNNYSKGESANHIGIYLGYQDGKHLFIHCGGYAWATKDRPLGQVIISALDQSYNGFPGVQFRRFYQYKGAFAD